VDALVALLHAGGEAAKESAARALLELSVNHLNRVSIALCGGIYPLVSLLRTGGPTAKEVAACAIWYLVSSIPSREPQIKNGTEGNARK
jgi:hypothetical protein